MRALLAIVVLLVAGCVPTQQTSQSTPPAPDAETGIAAYQHWEQQRDAESLKTAEYHLHATLQQQPDDIRLQYFYYNTLYALATTDWPFWHIRLAAQFDALNPLLKRDLTPPAFLEHFQMPKSAPLAQREKTLLRAVAQQPHSASSWYFLSLVYDDLSQLQQSLYAAQRADQLKPDNPHILFQKGSIYYRIARTDPCYYPLPATAQKAIKDISAAISRLPDDDEFREHIADIYSHSGLHPLAINAAQKAVKLNPSEDNRQMLAQVYFYAGDWTLSKQQYATLDTHRKLSSVIEVVALLEAADGNWPNARALYRQSLDMEGENLYEAMIMRWLTAINGLPLSEWQARDPNTLTRWQWYLQDYVINRADIDPVAIASDACQKTEAHFYMAMVDWLDGDYPASRQHLQQVRDLGVLTYVEYHWANVLLDSDLFSR